MSEDQQEYVSRVSRTQENQYKTVLPAEVVRELELEPGKEVGVVPECGDSLMVRIRTGVSGNLSNQRKLAGEGREMHQTVLRFPTSLAETLGLDGREIRWRVEDEDLVGELVEEPGIKGENR